MDACVNYSNWNQRDFNKSEMKDKLLSIKGN